MHGMLMQGTVHQRCNPFFYFFWLFRFRKGWVSGSGVTCSCQKRREKSPRSGEAQKGPDKPALQPGGDAGITLQERAGGQHLNFEQPRILGEGERRHRSSVVVLS